MSIKDLFDKRQTGKILSSKTRETLADGIESVDYLTAHAIEEERYLPPVDFSKPENFAHYGSAKEYYSNSIKKIYNTYPYDGSLKEKFEWENSASYLDKFIFEREYPRRTGYIHIGKTYGTLGNSSQGYYTSSVGEFIVVKGGPHASPTGDMKDGRFNKTYNEHPAANVFHTASNRGSNLLLDGDKGSTVEFWLKKSLFVSPHESSNQVIFDLWNSGNFGDHDYGRFRVEARPSATGSGDRFWVSLISGAHGTTTSGPAGGIYDGSSAALATSIGSNIAITGSAWKHYAISVANTGSTMRLRLYVDGQLHEQKILGNSIGSVPGAMKGYIGALATSVSGAYASTGWGKLSGSIDEFRYWKTERTPQEIGRFWRTQVGGGSNTDDANVQLGVYFKFNEGATGTGSVDSKILDYSGRISNGAWVGYASGSRNVVSSAIVEASASSAEFKDPIVYSFHPEVLELMNSSSLKATEWDYNNNSSIYRSFPSWIIDEDEKDDGNNLKKLTHIMASVFDNLQLQIDHLPNLKQAGFPSSSLGNSLSYKPRPFSDHLLESYGFDTSELFEDISSLEKYYNRNEHALYEQKLHDLKNLIYQNIYNGISRIYKSKGTERALRNLIRCFGIDDELLKINLYGNEVTYKLEENYRTVSQAKKYADFNDYIYNADDHTLDRGSYTAVVYQAANPTNNNTVSYISGTLVDYGNFLDGFAFTAEAEAIFPKPSQTKKYYISYPHLTCSVFGMNQVDSRLPTDQTTWHTGNVAQFNVYAVKPETNSLDARFILTNQNNDFFLSSSTFYDVFDNSKWNFAVSVRPKKYPFSDIVTGAELSSSGPIHLPNALDDYILEFYGTNTEYGTIIDEFALTASLPHLTGNILVSAPKKVYAGALRTNTTGTVLKKSNAKVSSVRYWLDYLTSSVVQAHARDALNFGSDSPYENSYLFKSGISTTYADGRETLYPFIPKMETLALNWDFSNVTGSDSSGIFYVNDFSSGSSLHANRYGKISGILNNLHSGKGQYFITSSHHAVDKIYTPSARQQLPEVLNSSDMINILTRDDTTFTRETRPIQYYIAVEKSMYQTISEEILNFFSSIKDFSNLIGDPVNRYRQEYKSLEKLRQLFFERIHNTPDLDKFVEFYKWFDSSITKMIMNLIPASANTSGQVHNMVESHILERNKYWTKFPTLESEGKVPEGKILGINELSYDWKHGHAPLPNSPLPESGSCFWWKERAERSTPEISSSVPGVNLDKESLLKTITTEVSASGPVLYDMATSKAYEGSTYVLRKLSKPYRFDIDKNVQAQGGPSSYENKKKDFYKNTLKWNDKLSFIRFHKNDFVKNVNCNDIVNPLTESKIKFKAKAHVRIDNEYTEGKGELFVPFSLHSSSVSDGYVGDLSKNTMLDITNLHEDNYHGNTKETTLQGPFTEKHVGGVQYRHIDLNYQDSKKRLDSELTRPEGWYIKVPKTGLYLSRFIDEHVWRDDKYSITLDGTGDYLSVDDHDDLSFGDASDDDPFSLSVWLKLGTTSDGTYDIITKHKEYNLQIQVASGVAKLYIFRYDNTTSDYQRSYSTLANFPNDWTHIVMAYDGSTNVTGHTIYVNGVSVARLNGGAGSYTAMHNTSNKVLIGGYDDDGDGSPNRYFNGSIGEISIWSTELDADQVEELFHLSISPYNTLNNHSSAPPHLIAYWKMGGHPGDATTDGTIHDVQNTHNATLFNNATAVASGLDAFPSYDPMVASSSLLPPNWQNLGSTTSDPHGWIAMSGSTLTHNTGPSGSYKSPWYMYADTSVPNIPGKTFGLVTPSIDPLDVVANFSASFYYHMFGWDCGELKVQYSIDPGFGTPVDLTTSWNGAESVHIAGQQQASSVEAWRLATVDLNHLKGTESPIYLRFLYTSGHTHEGDVAIDDVTVVGDVIDSFRVYDVTFQGPHRPRASYYRDEFAKRPVNIRNIKMTSSSPTRAGNYTDNYQVVQTQGRDVNNLWLVQGETGSAWEPSVSTYVSGVLDFRLPDRSYLTSSGVSYLTSSTRKIKNRTVFAERFSAPGGPEVLSRGAMDITSETYSPYNALPWRNLSVRQPLQGFLTDHSRKFGFKRNDGTNAYNFMSAGTASYHKIHRNAGYKRQLEPGTGQDGYASVVSASHDNYYVQHMIPRSERQYAWITASLSTHAQGESAPLGYATGSYSIDKKSSEITFLAQSEVGSVFISKFGGRYFGAVINTANSASLPDEAVDSYGNLIGASKVDFVGLNTNIYEPLTGSTNTLGYSAFIVKDGGGSTTIQDANYVNQTYVEGIASTYDETYLPFGASSVLNSILLNRNGPYGYPSWKQIRTGEHPVAKNLRKNNLYALRVVEEVLEAPHTPTVIKNKFLFFTESCVTSRNKPIITSFIHDDGGLSKDKGYSLKHTYDNNRTYYKNEFINLPHNIKAKWGFPGIPNPDKQVYDLLLPIIRDGSDQFGSEVSMGDFRSLKYSMTVFPKDINSYISKKTRRPNYAETAGASIDGPDSVDTYNLEQAVDGYDSVRYRTFWKNAHKDRIRTDGKARNISEQKIDSGQLGGKTTGSIPYVYNTFPGDAVPIFSGTSHIPVQLSVWPLDENTYGATLSASGPTLAPMGGMQSYIFYSGSYPGHAERPGPDVPSGYFDAGQHVENGTIQGLRGSPGQLAIDVTPLLKMGIPTASAYFNRDPFSNYFAVDASQDSDGYFIGIDNDAGETFWVHTDTHYGATNLNYFYKNAPAGQKNWIKTAPYYRANKIAGRNPWYNSYEEYSEDIRRFGKDHSVLSEYRMSLKVDDYLNMFDTTFTNPNHEWADYTDESKVLKLDAKTFVLDGAYKTTSSMWYRQSFKPEWDLQFITDHCITDSMVSLKKINNDLVQNGDPAQEPVVPKHMTLRLDAIKKLLPYNGFYPVTRTQQLAELYRRSLNPHIRTTGSSEDPVVHELNEAGKMQAAFQPLFAPGILFNSIKSGIAVDWPTYVLNAPATSEGENTDYNAVTGWDYQHNWASGSNLSSDPDYRIPFETLVNLDKLVFQSPHDEGPRSTPLLEPTFGSASYQTSAPNAGSSFTWFYGTRHAFVWETRQRGAQFEMAMNNFLAEVPNFFLQSRGRKGIFSKNQSEFTPPVAGKTYYMDVVLEKVEKPITHDFIMAEGPRDQLLLSGYTGSFIPDEPKMRQTNLLWTFADPQAGPRKGYIFGPAAARSASATAGRDIYIGRTTVEDVHWKGASRGWRFLTGSANFEHIVQSVASMPVLSASSPHLGHHDRFFNNSEMDPGYAMYTPPYYYGRSVARMYWTAPTTNTADVTIDQIISEIQGGNTDKVGIQTFNDYDTVIVPNSNASYDLLSPGYRLSDKHIRAIDLLHPYSVAAKNTMSITASMNLFDKATVKHALYGPLTGPDGKHQVKGFQDLVGGGDQKTMWVIRPKWECPVIDISASSYDSGYNHDVENGPYFSQRTGRSIWNSYADPTDTSANSSQYIFDPNSKEKIKKGIKYYLRESFSDYDIQQTGSLINLLGFDASNNENTAVWSPDDSNIEKRVGELAETTEIGECIVAIPYVEEPIENLTINPFPAISNSHKINAIPINTDEYYHQFLNLNNAEVDYVVIGAGNQTEQKSTTISRLMENMRKYIFPPEIDFYSSGIPDAQGRDYSQTRQKDAYGEAITSNGIMPFVMYTFEITSLLRKKDLADIWQNIMPIQAMRAEQERNLVSHSIGTRAARHEFFGKLDLYKRLEQEKPQFNQFYGELSAESTSPDQGLVHSPALNEESLKKIFNQEIKWLVFKVKKRALNSYEKLMNFDAFREDKISIKEKISYNWPHDFYSLSELNKITAQVTFGPKDDD